MCGITGYINLDGAPASPVILKRMTDVIAHRGPDGEGQYVDGNIAIGHRRLAIIDLSPAGHQPMVTRDSRYVLSYNGEIYNFQELRLELEALGYSFRSRTDSEVVLYAWAEWGEKCVTRFNGMFVFALYDRKEQMLFLVRDRYGIKPLYYAQWGNLFIFGSEQKAILAHPEAKKELDKKALLEYFTFQNIFTDRTLLKNVKLLPPATIASIRTGGRRSEVRSQRSEVGSRRSEVRSRRSEVGSRRSEVGSRRSEVGSRRSEVGSRRSEVRSRRSEVGSRRSEVGSRRSEVGSRRSEAPATPSTHRPTDSPTNRFTDRLTLSRYWDYRFREPESPGDPREYREELDRLLRQAVSRQLVSDVDLGSYLSGGMDSGTLTALAARELPYIKTFTCGFDLTSASGIEMAFDERFKAEAMSARFKTEHYEMVLKSGDMERCMPKLARHIEEPRVGQSYPNYYAAQLASKFVKVVLSGAGGDELFGGYPWRYYRATACTNFEHYIDQYYLYWQRLVDNRHIKQLFAPVWNDVKDVWTRDIFRDVFLTHDNELDRPEDYINHSLYFEAKTFLHGLFVIEDKLSMAHSLETRVPFMDNDLVDFAMRCPVNLKLNNLAEVVRINENEPGDKQGQFFKKTKDGKQILRDVMRNYIPDDIANATKQGFSAPDASWFKGESIEFVKRTILQPHAKIYDILDRQTVQSLVHQHLNGEQNRRLLIWSLLNVETWMNREIL